MRVAVHRDTARPPYVCADDAANPPARSKRRIARFHELSLLLDAEPTRASSCHRTTRPWLRSARYRSTRPTRSRRPAQGDDRELGKKDDFFNAGALADMAGPPAPDAGARRRQRRRRGRQDRRPRPPETRVGAHEAPAADAVGAARVLPGRAGGLRRPDPGRHGRPRAAAEGARPGISREADRHADHGALKRAGRRGDLAQRAREIQAALRAPHLGQPESSPRRTPPPCRPAPP